MVSGSMITSIFSLENASVILSRLGKDKSALKPWQKYRFTLPLFIISNMRMAS